MKPACHPPLEQASAEFIDLGTVLALDHQQPGSVAENADLDRRQVVADEERTVERDINARTLDDLCNC
jgi:hypothetical protein